MALRPSQDVALDEALEIRGEPDFVSRGGVKLRNALDGLEIDVSGLCCLDVGASTGGFTDCLLKRGATEVIALDVAYGQIDFGLRNEPRVTVIERLNARNLEPKDLSFAPELAVIDVSFISLTKVLGPVANCVAPGGEILAMVKPQFELGRKRVGRVADHGRALGLSLLGVQPTGLPGPKGNLETFLRFGTSGVGVEDGRTLCQGVEL
jgi:23S rRNA (cytidine1920-2'-O)/16S rRNA (cytidine1409-2'-O)-methyltransferase